MHSIIQNSAVTLLNKDYENDIGAPNIRNNFAASKLSNLSTLL